MNSIKKTPIKTANTNENPLNTYSKIFEYELLPIYDVKNAKTLKDKIYTK